MRILSVPTRHPYVAAVTPAEVQFVDPDRVAGWDPDPALDPELVGRWLSGTDLVHLHFGFDAWDTATAETWCRTVAAAGVALVLTVHDLRNPHHRERDRHDAVLTVLTARADAVITLTTGAAAELAGRFGRAAEVIPHPSLVDPSRTDDVRTEPRTVGVALKSLRGNVVEPIAVVRAAARGASAAGGTVRVDLHPELVDDPRLDGLAELARDPVVDVVVHPRFDDLELERYVRSLHATVLPYRFGTHSGWLELARDLGTRVIAPSCGHYADQWDRVIGYGNDEESGLNPEELSAAVTRALTEPPPEPADPVLRQRQAAQVREAHAEVYARVYARVRNRAGRGTGTTGRL